MKVINYNQAAKLAGVSRQCIQNMKKANHDKKKSYPFFLFDPKTGKHGIDIEDIAWKKYVDKDNSKRVNKKIHVKNTESKVNPVEQQVDVDKDNLLKAVVLAVKELYNISGKELNKLLVLIGKKYEGME